jgi:hypothetical protein
LRWQRGSSYTSCMGGVLHRFFVWTIVAALIVSGATWRVCIAGHLPAASPVSVQRSHEHHSPAVVHHEHHGDDSDGRHGGGHQGTGSHQQHSADDGGQLALDDHACLKCCSMCTVASVMPADPNPVVIFTISAVLFSVEQDHRSDRVVLIDPGIPKRTV